MMAYNLQSLVTLLEQILQPDQQRWNIAHDKRPQIESLLAKASSLKQIIENSPPRNCTRTERLESRIRDEAHIAEDIIESHMADQILFEPGGKSFAFSPPDLQQVIKEFDSVLHDWLVITDKIEMVNTSSPCGVSLTPDSSSKDTVVGLDEDILRLKDRLTGDQRKLEIIPVVGMGGIGKTTLAQNLYNDQNLVSHFDTRAWVVISQEYNMRAILLGLLGCIIGKLSDELFWKEDSQLALTLYQSLIDRRYLIVLDDMWSKKVWDDIKMYFPEDDNGSRIILTTREVDVANYVGSMSPQHHMHLLNKSESWNLLQKKVFGKENCPIELERIGQNIASSCGGLPLAIHVIGGLLSKANRITDSWEHVAYDIRAATSENNDQVLNVLFLSYKHLPSHLKPCFLYMGAFPEDYEIRASKLIRLWVAERFLKSNGDKSPEEEAEDCLKALVGRNLIVVTQHKSNRKAKSYSIHDLLRELCIREAMREKFLFSKSQIHYSLADPSNCIRRVSLRPSCCIEAARSFLCIGGKSYEILPPQFSELRLLRVLDVYDVDCYVFPEKILQLVNLRYLALFWEKTLPSAISRFWDLETLLVRSDFCTVELPSEIWEMPRLRHILYGTTRIVIKSDNWKDIIQEKLETISTVDLAHLRETNFLRSIPNIKCLAIYSGKSLSGVVDLQRLHKLETLKCSCGAPRFSGTFLSTLSFPPSLRKLTLRACKIPQRFMKTVASLPNLEMLKIHKCAFEGEKAEADDEQEWNSIEEEFCSLQFLLLEYLELVHWQADQTNFPRLRHLVIRRCNKLKEIPSGIGENQTLELIEVDYCSPSVEDSARKIQANQLELGNDDVQFHISSMKMIERGENLTVLNNKAEDLQYSAQEYKKQETQIQRKMWYQNMKRKLALLRITILLILIIWLSVCHGFDCSN